MPAQIVNLHESQSIQNEELLNFHTLSKETLKGRITKVAKKGQEIMRPERFYV
jgi:hypothetical protein